VPTLPLSSGPSCTSLLLRTLTQFQLSLINTIHGSRNYSNSQFSLMSNASLCLTVGPRKDPSTGT
jgi:hypothetical protein